jgi:hypothetical protein
MKKLMQAPKITTAIPQRRYRLADFSAVVLGEIESPDPARYRYILALVKEGDATPSFYVTSEKNPRSEAHTGSHRLRIISEILEDVIESSDRYADLDVFSEEALRLAAETLGLGAAEPVRLM